MTTTVATLTTSNKRTFWQTAWAFCQSELYYLAWALTEVAFIVPISLSLMGWARYWPAGQVALWALLLILLPFNLIRLMTLQKVPTKQQQTVMVVALLITIFLSLRLLVHPQETFLGWVVTFFTTLGDPDNRLWARDLYTFTLVALLWWRGIRLVGIPFDVQRVGARLRSGGLLLAPLTIGLVRDYLLWDVTPFLLLFFAATLTAVSLVRMEQIERERSGQAAPVTLRWLGTILLTIFSLILTAIAITTFVSGNGTDAVVGWLAPLWRAIHFSSAIILTIASYLIVPLIVLLTWIAERIAALITRLFNEAGGGLPDGILDLSNFQTLIEQLTEPETVAADPTLPVLGTRLIVILIMVAIVLIISLTLTRRYRRAAMGQQQGSVVGNETAVNLPPKPSLMQQLLRRLGFRSDWLTANSIRRIYAHMCYAAATVGTPRTEAETPYEYMKHLKQIWPAHSAEIERITQAYVRIHYGELPESKTELEAIRQAWHTLQNTIPHEQTN